MKITTHLWFDREAKEASEFYTSVFPNSKVIATTTLYDTPSGDCDVVSFELSGHPFMSISAGPLFKFTPAVSFLVACETKEEVDLFWRRLSDGGTALMPLDSYPFSERYGWTQDKYGLSWQIMYAGEPVKQKITPVLMFVGEVCGQAEEAIRFYESVFSGAKVGDINRYGKGEEPNKEGTVKYADFRLEGQEFGAMDSGLEHLSSFNEAISFLVNCSTQKEIDYYWEKLSAFPKAEQCGWLKDKFGLSWQIVPTIMDDLLAEKDKQKVERITKAFLKMKKFNIAELEKAAEGR